MSDEPRRLIVNIRGANASGKTTLARRFIPAATMGFDRLNMHLCTAPDGTEIRYSSIHPEGLQLPVMVIGTYDESKYSGMDKVKSADAICYAVSWAAQTHGAHHTLFEGFRVSKSYARFAELRNSLVRETGQTWLWALMHAPVELIYERAAARREDGKEIDHRELAAVVRQMDKTRSKVREAWPRDALTLDPRQPPEALYERLVGEMAARERGETLGAS